MEKLDPEKSTPYAFIPKRLEIPDNPELAVFPLNILFVSLANIDRVDTSGRALYLPQLDTYTSNNKYQTMNYYNKFCKPVEAENSYSWADYIELVHFEDSGWYEGTKYIGGTQYSKSVGKDWQTFFVHLTATGLASGEACEFKPLHQYK